MIRMYMDYLMGATLDSFTVSGSNSLTTAPKLFGTRAKECMSRASNALLIHNSPKVGPLITNCRPL